MVRGAVLTVTPVPGTYQCAETDSIALGRGVSRPSRAQPSVYALVRSAFIGLPCPTNSAGSVPGMAPALRPGRASSTRDSDRASLPFYPGSRARGGRDGQASWPAVALGAVTSERPG